LTFEVILWRYFAFSAKSQQTLSKQVFASTRQARNSATFAITATGYLYPTMDFGR